MDIHIRLLTTQQCSGQAVSTVYSAGHTGGASLWPSQRSLPGLAFLAPWLAGSTVKWRKQPGKPHCFQGLG